MIDPLTQLDSLQLGFLAFQRSDSGMAVLSKQHMILAANVAFHRLLGYADQQLHGVYLDTLLHPRIHTLGKDRWETLREFHFLHHDGHHVEAQVTMTPLDPSNTASGSFLLQITKTIVYRPAPPLSAEISAVSNPSLEEILDGIPDGFVCLDSFGRFTYINKAAERMILASREALLGTYIWNSFPEAIGSPLYDHYLSCTATQLPDKLETYCASNNRWLEIHAYPNEHTYCALLKDITLSKDNEREKSLQESEKMYRMIAENSTDMIARISLDGVFLYISPASRTLLGYEPEELIGRRVYEYFHPEEFQVRFISGKTAVERFESESFRLPFPQKGRSLRLVRIDRPLYSERAGTS
ncbi:PAS domain S-box protein [Paenibacillus sp. TAB 01]|uniref:PAS domain-containing protein n=1 Tax=Paenibacillus sp. TAB 01 TaxID=3368988 RepID=UPI003750DFB7